jgi:hypothetical protein
LPQGEIKPAEGNCKLSQVKFKLAQGNFKLAKGYFKLPQGKFKSAQGNLIRRYMRAQKNPCFRRFRTFFTNQSKIIAAKASSH